MVASHSRAARRRTALTAAGGIALVLVLAGVLLTGLRGALQRSADAGAIGGPFSLIDMTGHPVTAQSFHGRFLLIYFGYTRCPDICPTTLATVTAALGQMGGEAARIQPLFITVDPAHDSADVLRRYTAAFSPALIGLTGTPTAIADIERRYHVEAMAGPGGIAHSAALYVLGPDGGFRTVLSPQQTAGTLATALRETIGRG